MHVTAKTPFMFMISKNIFAKCLCITFQNLTLLAPIATLASIGTVLLDSTSKMFTLDVDGASKN